MPIIKDHVRKCKEKRKINKNSRIKTSCKVRKRRI